MKSLRPIYRPPIISKRITTATRRKESQPFKANKSQIPPRTPSPRMKAVARVVPAEICSKNLPPVIQYNTKSPAKRHANVYPVNIIGMYKNEGMEKKVSVMKIQAQFISWAEK
jgi:hypothetical protein